MARTELCRPHGNPFTASARWAGAYAWAQCQLQNPAAFAQALALFPGEQEQLSTPIGHAFWLILSTKSEPSYITRKLMLTDALETWERHARPWLESVVETCGALGITTSAELTPHNRDCKRAIAPGWAVRLAPLAGA